MCVRWWSLRGYLPVARQIQVEELFGVDLLSRPLPTLPSPRRFLPDFLEAAPHEPFAPQLAAGP